jgi:glutaredoxin-related protein
MLFMKGSPDAPRCGFSRKVADALASEGIAYGSFDILSDERVRQGLKALSNWPTYPQVCVCGGVVCVCVCVCVCVQGLCSMRGAPPTQRGAWWPPPPPPARAPTQVYVRGELLGGCDIVLEMQAAGELKVNVDEMLHRMQDPN